MKNNNNNHRVILLRLFKEHFLLHLLPSLLNTNKMDQVLQQYLGTNRPLREPSVPAELCLTTATG